MFGKSALPKIIAVLERPTTTLDFFQALLSDVCEYVSEVQLVKISIEDAGLEDMPVTFSSTAAVPLGITTHAMLEPLGLDGYLSPNAVVITDRARVEKSQPGLSKLKGGRPTDLAARAGAGRLEARSPYGFDRLGGLPLQ